MKRRKPAPIAEPTPERIVIPPAPDEPVWGTPSRMPRPFSADDFAPMNLTVGQVVSEWRPRYMGTDREIRYTLPTFQREWSDKWSADRCCAYLNSVLHGEPQTPIVVWDPWNVPAIYLLDGQHRLCSLGATVLDHEGNRRPRPEVCFDLVRAEWVSGKADGVTTFSHEHLIHADDMRWEARGGAPMPDRWRSDAYWEALRQAGWRMEQADLRITTLRLADTPESWRRALSFFELLNRSVPFTEAELADLRAHVAALPTDEVNP